ncbi:MAG: TROVE domain-containing protein [Gallionellaceae bacterium]|jgi:hypothetical protein|nr:TROVE domain-containing protein [Gallionellaceae bacterium]
MRLNVANQSPRTHEGAPAVPARSPLDQLRRTVLSCLLWENSFYEDGVSVAERIKTLAAQVAPQDLAALAIEARGTMRLRHAPLLLVRELARHPVKLAGIADVIDAVIQRADELTEFLAIYWKDGRQALSKQTKLGLAAAFRKFDAYQLAKYDRADSIKLRDVLFLCHAKPQDEAQAQLWKALVDGTLPVPDTWETALSSGADKKTTFERLIAERKLGYLALLRNLRNMHQAGVDETLVREALLAGAARSKALPFRFVAAARAVPAWESTIDEAMRMALCEQPKLTGRTVVLVDVSGSMDCRLSGKSDLSRLDAACALAVLVRGIAEEVRVFSFSERAVEVPARSGMALVDAIVRSQPHASTYLGAALESVKAKVPQADRIIVVTDEQAHDVVGGPGMARGYMLNVAAYENGVGYGDWTRITGFSESVVQYIQAMEAAT